MKLLIFTSRAYPQKGGVEEVVEFISNKLSNHHSVHILASKANNISLFNISDNEVERNRVTIKRIWIGLPSSFLGLIVFPIRFLLSFVQVVQYVTKIKPDVINYHFPDDSSIYFYLLMLVRPTKFVVNIHGNDLQVFRKKFLHKFFIDGIVRKANKVVLNSKYMREEFLRVYPILEPKTEIIPNAIDIDLIRKIKSRRFFSNPYMFFVGRLVYKKGVDVLLKAFKKAAIDNMSMLVEGDGEEYEKLKKLRHELSLEDKVVFTRGKLTHEDKYSYMKEAILGVMPSRIEPFGIVALEFFAAKVPLIASDTGGLSTLIRNKHNGILVKADDVNNLAESIRSLYDNKLLRENLVLNAYKFVKSFSIEAVAKEYDKLFLDSL